MRHINIVKRKVIIKIMQKSNIKIIAEAGVNVMVH